MCACVHACVCVCPIASAPLETSISACLSPVMLCDGHREDNEQKSCSLGSQQRRGRGGWGGVVVYDRQERLSCSGNSEPSTGVVPPWKVQPRDHAFSLPRYSR